MSSQDSKQQQKKLSLERVSLEGIIKVDVSEQVLSQIKFLCRKISTVEWSGVLFYTVQGTIADVNNRDKMVITLQEILLMDKGDAGTTGFDWDEDIMNKHMEHMDEGWLVGHIHSHHSMGVFFSGTDWDELNDNCQTNNYYLSVIVNNRLDCEAKVAYTGNNNTYICLDEEGKEYRMKIESSKPKMFVNDCDIMLVPAGEVSEEFASRLEIIEERYKSKPAKSYVSGSGGYHNEGFKDWENHNSNVANDNKNKHQNHYFIEQERKRKEQDEKKSRTPDFDPTKKEWPIDQVIKEEKEIREEKEDKNKDDYNTERQMTLAEEFGAYLVRLGREEDDDHIDTAMWDVDLANINGEDYVTMMMANYETYHNTFYEKMPKKNDIVGTTEELIEFFSMAEVQHNYEFLEYLVTGLKQFLINMSVKSDELEGKI